MPAPALPPQAIRRVLADVRVTDLLREATQDDATHRLLAGERIAGTTRLAAEAKAWLGTWASTPATQAITAINGHGHSEADALLRPAAVPILPRSAAGWTDADELRALLPPMSAAPATATAALAGSLAERQRHAWLPWVAHAGSDEGTGVFRDPARRPAALRLEARAFGAIPDDDRDDADAITAALRAAGAGGGGVVSLEAGRYVLDRPIGLGHDDVALIGAGSARTRLLLRRSLSEATDINLGYSWRGGMLWCSPLERIPTHRGMAWFDRLPARGLWAATATRQGATALALTGPDLPRLAEVQPGALVRLEWTLSATTCRLIGADPAFDHYPWALWEGADRLSVYARVERIDGGTLHLVQGLRLPVLTCTPVQVNLHPLVQQRIAVRGLTIAAATRAEAQHLREPGFNGIMAEGVVGAEFSDIVGENLDNVLIIERSQHVTARLLTSSGPVRAHHFVSIRGNSHDNLIEDFRIAQRTWHGISVQDKGAGNVFRRGQMHAGTFDSHRGMPSDTVRTDITISNTGVPGGDANAGPYAGRRMVHWNVRIVGGRDPQRVERWSEWIHVPELHPYGALVGVRGAPPIPFPAPRRPWPGNDLPMMPRGIGSALVLDAGVEPATPDLYAAQRQALRGGTP